MHDARISFYSPTAAMLAQQQKDFAAAEKTWAARAKAAGIRHPAALLTTFRKAIADHEDAE